MPEISRKLTPDRSLTVPAYAKINLFLRVLGRRADGYHEIETIFQTVTLSDRLTFTPLAGDAIKLECGAPDVPADERNLVFRAALAVREHFRVRRGAKIRLEKRIPTEAGLGGGSSDAAVALAALACLWEIETDRQELAELGAKLGADVPFFLTGGRASGTGTGTEIQPLEDVPVTPLVILTPDVKVSTVEAYRALRAPALTKNEALGNLLVSRAEAQIPDSLCDGLRNDFEPVIYGLRPEIERARDALREAGARCAMLSGSGSSVFGIFDSHKAAARAEMTLREKTNWQAFACQTLRRDEYGRALGVSLERL